MPARRRVLVLSSALTIACAGGEDDAGDTEAGTSDATTPVTHGSQTTATATVTATFTNTSDPTSDPSASDDPSLASSSEGSTSSVPTSSSSEGDATSGAPTSEGGDATTGDTGDPGGPCCSAQNTPGCGDPAIEACVCETDDFCCRNSWDDFCTVQVVTNGCAECPGIGGDGDCCAAHDNPGCDDDAIEACVCNMDYVCCLDPWDDLCVDAAVDCGAPCN